MLLKTRPFFLLFAIVITSIILGMVSGLALWQLGVKPSKNSRFKPIFSGISPIPTFESVPNVPSGLFNYGGSTTWVPLRQEIDPIIQKTLPQFKLRYTDPITGDPGSGTGIKMLLDNQLSFSQSSRPLNLKEYQQAKSMGFTLEEVPIAIDAIVVGVHPQLNVSRLTIEQLQKIYTQKITNWSQVGGQDLLITPYSKDQQESGTAEFFVNNVLLGQQFGKNTQIISTTTEAMRKVSNNQGGIYYASAPELIPQCGIKPLSLGSKPGQWVTPYKLPLVSQSNCPKQRNQLNHNVFRTGDYPMTRRLFVIIKRNGQVDEQAGTAYAKLLLTDEGQALVVKAGFISLR